MEATTRGIHRRTLFAVNESLRLRLASRVLKNGPLDCWPWLGAMRNGYGAIKQGGHVISAHVAAWSIAAGRGPGDGKIICHTCDNRVCCNPAHLYEGTPTDNNHDMEDRRRFPRPVGNEVYNAVLSAEAVKLIHSLRICRGWGSRRIGNAIGHSQSAVGKVLGGKTWRHVNVPSQHEAAAIVIQWNATHQR
jgi:hypothetical protein